MKANELRIGNIVKSLVNNEEFSIVDEIGHKGALGYYVSLNNQSSYIWLQHNDRDLVLPIPLTEEWLLKLPEDLVSEDIPSWINSIHELQNWYWIENKCKKELVFK